MRVYFSLFLLLTLAAPAWSATANFVLDQAHSSANFSVRHLMITNVKGTFSELQGQVVLDDKNPANSTFSASIGVASIDTGIADRDDHLRSPDFFNVQKFPTIDFKSTSVKKLGPALYQVAGNLTIHGTTKPVQLQVEGLDQEVKDPWGNIKRGARITGAIDRRDFGMTWNKAVETGGVVVGNEVRLEVELQLVKK